MPERNAFRPLARDDAGGIRGMVVQLGRQEAFLQGQQAESRLDGTGGAGGMSREGFGGRNGGQGLPEDAPEGGICRSISAARAN